MPTRASILAILITLVGAGAGHAQTSVSGRATLVVPELLTLRVLSDVTPEATSSVEGTMIVEVVANRGWQLSAVLESEDGRQWTTAPVATGGPGRTPVRLDYGVLVAGAGADPDSAVRLTLSPL